MPYKIIFCYWCGSPMKWVMQPEDQPAGNFECENWECPVKPRTSIIFKNREAGVEAWGKVNTQQILITKIVDLEARVLELEDDLNERLLRRD